MAIASNRRSSGALIRSLPPSGRSCSSSVASASRFYSSNSGFASSPSSFSGSSAASSYVRFSNDRLISPSRSISAVRHDQVVRKQNGLLPSSASGTGAKRTCLCSPTTHPGSFRCSLHKSFISHHAPYSSNRLNTRKSAMTNSLVRFGTVEGDLVKRALAVLIRPSSHKQKRRSAFQPRPSRLSIMSKATNDVSQ